MTGGTWSWREALAGGLARGAMLAAPARAQATESDRIDALVASFMTAFDTRGIAVTLVRAGGPVFARGHGVRKLGSLERVDADTVFGIASNSKSFVASPSQRPHRPAPRERVTA